MFVLWWKILDCGKSTCSYNVRCYISMSKKQAFMIIYKILFIIQSYISTMNCFKCMQIQKYMFPPYVKAINSVGIWVSGFNQISKQSVKVGAYAQYSLKANAYQWGKRYCPCDDDASSLQPNAEEAFLLSPSFNFPTASISCAYDLCSYNL